MVANIFSKSMAYLFILVSTTNWHLPWALAIYFYKSVKSVATAATDLQHPLKEFRVEGRPWWRSG